MRNPKGFLPYRYGADQLLLLLLQLQQLHVLPVWLVWLLLLPLLPNEKISVKNGFSVRSKYGVTVNVS